MPGFCLWLSPDGSPADFLPGCRLQSKFKSCFISAVFLKQNISQIFSKSLKAVPAAKPQKFAIDLRSPEELEEEIKNELDSEAWKKIEKKKYTYSKYTELKV